MKGASADAGCSLWGRGGGRGHPNLEGLKWSLFKSIFFSYFEKCCYDTSHVVCVINILPMFNSLYFDPYFLNPASFLVSMTSFDLES